MKRTAETVEQPAKRACHLAALRRAERDACAIAALNAEARMRQWFVCYDCNFLACDEQAHYLATSKWGAERAFCRDCVRRCGGCDAEYCEEMAYAHRDCSARSESESELLVVLDSAEEESEVEVL